VSKQNPFGGPNLAIIVMLLGLIGFLIEPLLVLVFIVVLGYELYRVEKRLAAVEAPTQKS